MGLQDGLCCPNAFEVGVWQYYVVQAATHMMHSHHKARHSLICVGCHEAMLLQCTVQSLHLSVSLAFIHGFDIAPLIPEIEEEPAHVVGAPVEPALPRRIGLPQEALMRCRSAL